MLATAQALGVGREVTSRLLLGKTCLDARSSLKDVTAWDTPAEERSPILTAEHCLYRCGLYCAALQAVRN